MQYLLAIDGGGSKTLGVLLCQSSGQRWQAQSGPAQLSNDFASAIKNVRDICQQLCQQAHITTQQITAVLGLAGASNPEQHTKFYQELALPFAKWQLTTDARTSLYGANLGEPVAVVAVGTGSVAMRLQADGTELQVGGWGFHIGDEGGGAWLGQQLVRQLLWQLDWQQSLSPMLQAVANQCGDEAASILPWLKQATPADFASLAPLVYQFAEPMALQLQAHQAEAISELALCCLNQHKLPLVLLGGLANQCQHLLTDTLRRQLQPAKGDALAGGLVLAAQLAVSS